MGMNENERPQSTLNNHIKGVGDFRDCPYKILFREITAGLDTHFRIFIHFWFFDYQIF
jgi:hypothetical protein